MNGHMLYASNAITSEHCKTCGEPFISNCTDCGERLPHQFRSRAYLTSGTPVTTPKRPAHCGKCGAAHPWTVRDLKTADAPTATDALSAIKRLCARFHLVARQLRQRHSDRTTIDIMDEYDVQDVMHAMLRIYFDDVRAEETTPSYAAKSSRIDFLVKSEEIGIEVKMTRVGLSDREIGNQLIEDIARYKSHPNCRSLVCFVYDPDGRVTNPDGLTSDLSGDNDGFSVHVLVVPCGI